MHLRRALVAGAVISLVLISTAGPIAAAAYTIEPVTANRQSSDPRVVIDAAGHRHVAFTVVGADAGIHYSTNSTGTWVDMVIASTGGGHGPSIAIDPDGSPAIAWSAAGGGIDYASLSDGWSVESVSAEPGDAEASLAFDPAGHPHIAMRLGVQPEFGQGLGLFYASSDGVGGWAIEQLTTFDYDRDPSLAIDSTGRSHIAYNNGGDQLEYLSNPAGVWTSVDVGLFGVSRLDLALDASDRPHIATASPGDGVYLATPDGDPLADPWRSELVSSGYHDNPSLVIDANGIDHVAYDDGPSTNPVVATKVDGAWQTPQISASLVDKPELAIDPSTDRLVVAMDPAEDQSDSGVIVSSADAAGTWASVQVSADAVDRIASLAVDPQGGEHIAFGRVGTGPGVYYSSKIAGHWQANRIADTSNNLAGLALAIGPDGSAHLIYETRDNSTDVLTLTYATNRSGAWAMTVIQTGSSGPATGRDIAVGSTGSALVPYVQVGRRASVVLAEISARRTSTKVIDRSGFFAPPSIDLDAAGNVHLIYQRDNALIYASNAGGHWKSEVAATAQAGFNLSSVAVGSSGQVTIAGVSFNDRLLHVLTRGLSGWSDVPVALPGGAQLGRFDAPSLDVAGTVREIAVTGGFDNDNLRLYRVSDRTSEWVAEDIAAAEGALTPSLAVESGGTVGIVFLSGPSLMIARG